MRAIFSLFVVLVAAVALVSASGAATMKAQKLTRFDVSTRAAVVGYLRSMHVDAKGVVIQRGSRNYAGANCPGKGWSCTTTAHTVVQVARAGGKNSFSCSTGKCRVLQVATSPSIATNTAKCIINTTGQIQVQGCLIIQSSSSANNVAVVYEKANGPTGLAQTAATGAAIIQRATGASNSNTACVYQAISLTGSKNVGSGNVNVSLGAHQAVTIDQDSAHGGNSASSSATSKGACDTAHPLTQTQTLSSVVKGPKSITQNENVASLGENVKLDIEQNQSSGFKGSGTGPNSAIFDQTNSVTSVANTPHGPVSQTQSSPTGGIVGTVNQDSTGVETVGAMQTETQCEDAATSGLTTCDRADLDPPGYSLTQTQYGPASVKKMSNKPSGGRQLFHVSKGNGTSTQTGGNLGDTFVVHQTSTQDNDTGSGQTNVVQADCSTSGNCTVTQNTDINGQQDTNTQSGQDVNTTTNCTGSECTSTGGGPSLELLPNGLAASNVDVGEFGQGGMRGDGTGTVDVNGITGPVFRAFLYWHGPTNSSDSTANADVMFNGSAVTGTNIGFASDNNWGFQNSQSYRADVTGLMTGLSGGSASYSLGNFRKTEGDSDIADINGVALIVFYDDGNTSDDRNVVLWNGNDSNQPSAFDSDSQWDETISGVPYPGSGSASLDLVVSDGQSYADGELDVDGSPVAAAGDVFQGATGPNYGGNPEGVTGSLWDIESFGISSFLSAGTNEVHITSPVAGDALSLVVAIANVPAAAETE